MSPIINGGLLTQSPSEVCQMCLQQNPNAIWLSWLKCVNPMEHSAFPTVTVVANNINKQLVRVRPLPANITDIGLIGRCPRRYCQVKERCTYAHSAEEANYWKWQSAIRVYEKVNSIFEGLHKDFCPNLDYVCGVHLQTMRPDFIQATNQSISILSKEVRSFMNLSILFYKYMQLLIPFVQGFLYHLVFPSFQSDSQFNALYSDYKYPDEINEFFVKSLTSPLTKENYKSKYHKLIYLEEIESSRKIIQE